ncbi:D-isomer specific 2-hydroxyacid dehydrogenase [Naematelia encephala]|uniref:D-isomer specific 2-hydroxyacid dehydrogenase n=1 Tax=Naematelia encephala TaxID=71784 RepID=A0A1Y2ACY1_9TREE|nr:D-isomer specific 2-hydroxyacid dehydrogenase [Naematelia encephala]
MSLPPLLTNLQQTTSRLQLTDLLLDDGHGSLPTPPPEPLLAAREATVLLPMPVHPVAAEYARSRFGKVLVVGEDVDLDEGLKLADGILNRANALPADMLVRAQRLLAISVVGVGYDSIHIPTCIDRRISVLNCPGSNAHAVSELTIALTLALLRRVPEVDRRLRSGQLVRSIDVLGRSLRGKVVGIIGMGATARCTAEIFLHAFSCSIHIYSPTSPLTRWTTHDPSGALAHTRHDTLSAMLPHVDILTLHCPLTDATRRLISSRELDTMKPGSVLVNMSRGAVVDEKALYDALRSSETLMGAASDVFAFEPVGRDTVNGLLDLENFIATPHMSVYMH